MIRIITILSFCLITTAMLAQTEPCDCEWQFDDSFICAQDSTGNIFPVPNECFADCFGLTVVDSTECDLSDTDWGDDFDNDWDTDFDLNCDCDESDFEGEGICIELTEAYDGDTLTYQVWAPSVCFADCLGYENYTVIECDSIEWDLPFDDCDCELSDDEDFICVLTNAETGEICPFPNLCFAECAGYSIDDVMDCDSIDLEWYNDWNDGEFDFTCECDESDLEGEGICIQVTSTYEGDTLTYEAWAPSECYAECWGYGDFIVVECDTTGWDWDDWDNGNNDDWNDACDCDESDLEGEGICIQVTATYEGDTLTYEAWAPSECYAECWGYEDFIVVECDTTGYTDPWDDCDCEYTDEDEFVCVLTDVATGEICPFPNICYAECAGYTAADVVDCDFPELDCFDCLDEEINPVCAQDSLGNIFPVPNQCFADCLGLIILDDDDCGGLVDGNAPNNDVAIEAELPQYQSEKVESVSLRVYPNPATDELVLEFDLNDQELMTTVITDAQGKIAYQNKEIFLKGLNTNKVHITDLTPGIYIVSMKTSDNITTQKFIKN